MRMDDSSGKVHMLEIIHPLKKDRRRLKAVLFDFDGTLSTLRCGWETVMSAMIREILAAGLPAQQDPSGQLTGLEEKIAAYIDASTGIQTIFQMQWLAGQVAAQGRTPLDPWEYKAEYNRRLMQTVALRREAVQSGKAAAEQYLVAGSRVFLDALRDRGITLYVASGTDQPDVAAEAGILGLAHYFKEIVGAPLGQMRCSKEQVVRQLLQASDLLGEELAVIGDGKVEISIACESGALALGVASDEKALSGVNPDKRRRLVAAGAHAITGDFLASEDILDWLNI